MSDLLNPVYNFLIWRFHCYRLEGWRLTDWSRMMRMIVCRYLVLDKGGNISVSYLWSIHLVDDVKDCI